MTDADLVLGLIGADSFLGGTMTLDVQASEHAIGRLAERLGLSTLETAAGIVDVVNETMARAARVHLIERGFDPAGFAMISFGGAGPVHAYAVARLLGVCEIVVPPAAGALSALGLLESPVGTDAALSRLTRLSDAASGEVEAIYGQLEARALERLANMGSFADVAIERLADIRYEGQGYELLVSVEQRPAGRPRPDGPSVEAAIAAQFEKQYEAVYGRRMSRAIEVVTWRVVARARGGSIPEPAARAEDSTAAARPRLVRPVYFSEHRGYVETPVFQVDSFPPGASVAGPAVIEQRESTFVVGPSSSVTRDSLGYFRVTLGEPATRRNE